MLHLYMKFTPITSTLSSELQNRRLIISNRNMDIEQMLLNFLTGDGDDDTDSSRDRRLSAVVAARATAVSGPHA